MVRSNAARHYPGERGGHGYGAQVPQEAAELDEFAETLGAELDQQIASLDPIDLATGHPRRPDRQSQRPVYDPWDDEALDQFLEDFDLDAIDPVAVGGVDAPAGSIDGPQEDAAGRPRWRLALLVGAALLLLAGGGGAYMMLAGSAGFGPPPLVRAPEGPYKVLPDPDAKKVATTVEGKAVFDSVDGIPPKGDERLVTRSPQVSELPPVTPQVSRVTLPDGQEVEADLPAGVDPADIGPRRVRTVLVRPDGTLIDNPNSAPGASLAKPAAPDATGQFIAQAEESDSSGDLPPLPSSEQTTAGEPAKPAAATSTEHSAALAMAAPQTPAETTATPSVAIPRPPVRPLPPAPSASNASSSSQGPLDLMAAAGGTSAPAAQPAPQKTVEAAAVASAPVAAAGAYVQLSSQRSQEAALSAFRALQRKYPALLGGLQPDIQKADLGAKGVYYRLRVGQPDRDQAAALCERLRAAGGQCLLAR